MRTFKIYVNDGVCPYYTSRLILEHDKGSQFNLWVEYRVDQSRPDGVHIATITPAFLRKLADILEEEQETVVKTISLYERKV